ncbi:NAD-dependent epimerase/dehydratase family protein [Compostibacter hankyongensis]|uniref:GDP-mannose 4,6-dehydratase n=1 Tax=Compostibacter hankyongensis TaxID=1007089 RepID=A0ABP8FPB5_9BACT
MNTVLLTGGAGFIGGHLTERLLAGGYRVICVDNFDDFYPASDKEHNLSGVSNHPNFRLLREDILALTPDMLDAATGDGKVDIIVHLAAKAGVRPSLEMPEAYYRTNVSGTLHLLELARRKAISRFIFGSSSSVYGDNPKQPWKESDTGLRPISPYGASKLAGEEIGAVYAHLYAIRFIALRFFTVYGPRQRPDLAIHKFYNRLSQGQEITLYGDGSTARDYTYIDDIVTGIEAAMQYDKNPYAVFNIGSGRPLSLQEMVTVLSESMQCRANIRHTGEQPGDVRKTWADLSLARQELHYNPGISFREGIAAFLEWKKTSANPTNLHP